MWREALNIIRGQLHQPGKSFLVIKYASGHSWKSDSWWNPETVMWSVQVIDTQSSVQNGGGASDCFLAPGQKDMPKPGVLRPRFCCWPGSSCSPQPSAKDWSHSHLLFQDPLCGCARSWALALFHLFGEDALCQGHANHHLEIIFGHRKLFSSRRWRLCSDSRSETLECSERACQEEVLTERCPGDRVYRLTFGVCCSERAEAPASMGPALLGRTQPRLCWDGVQGGLTEGNEAGSRNIYSLWGAPGPEPFKSLVLFFNALLPSAAWLLGPCG